MQLDRPPRATCSFHFTWVRQDSNLRSPKAAGLQPATFAAPQHTRNFTAPPHTGLEPVPTPRQGAVRTLTPIRQRYINQPFQGELGNRTLATTFTVSGAATTPSSPSRSAEEEGVEPSPHDIARPRLANACDETGIRLSSDTLSPPGIEPGFRASHARVVVRSTTGTFGRMREEG